LTFVLDGQQRLTALYVGLQGTYNERKTKSGKGSRTEVPKKLFLNLLHDGRVPDAEEEVYYQFEFFDHEPVMIQRNSFWFEVGRILRVGSGNAGDINELIQRQIKAIRDLRALNSHDAEVVKHNLVRLYESIWDDKSI